MKLKESKQTENYKEFIYEKGLYLDNMVFLKYNEEKEEKDNKKENIFFNIIEENEKSNEKEYRKVLIFFNEPNLEDIISEKDKKLYII